MNACIYTRVMPGVWLYWLAGSCISRRTLDHRRDSFFPNKERETDGTLQACAELPLRPPPNPALARSIVRTLQAAAKSSEEHLPDMSASSTAPYGAGKPAGGEEVQEERNCKREWLIPSQRGELLWYISVSGQ